MDLKEFETLSPETKTKVLADFLNARIKLTKENEELAKQLQMKEKQIEVAATQGLDIRKIHPVEEIEEYLNFEKGYLQNLLVVDESEYLKAIMSRHHALMDEKVRMLLDKQIDVNGEEVATKIKTAVAYFQKYRTIDSYTPEATGLYTKSVNDLIDSIAMLWIWKASTADMANFNEAVTHGVMQYAIKEITDKNKSKINARPIAIDPEKELEARKLAETVIAETKEKEVAKLNNIESMLNDFITRFSPQQPQAIEVNEQTSGETEKKKGKK